MQSHLSFCLKVLPSQSLRLSAAAAGILFQVNAAWLVWKSTAVPDHTKHQRWCTSKHLHIIRGLQIAVFRFWGILDPIGGLSRVELKEHIIE